MSTKNKISWNEGAAAYSARFHTEKIIDGIIQDPSSAFHPTTWEMIRAYLPDLRGKRVCVPSSGDNHAVFALAILGARVTSCDISENQLANAENVAQKYGWGESIEFISADTMKLENIRDNEYDFVYTSNGVHVWINDLTGMYHHIRRVMKPGGVYILFEIHPFQRPFDDHAKVIKPYDKIGPFEDENEITFAWRVMDIMNAMLKSGLAVKKIEEMYAVKDYENPFWLELDAQIKGVTATREEVDSMHDWRKNPMAALPNWMSIAAIK